MRRSCVRVAAAVGRRRADLPRPRCSPLLRLRVPLLLRLVLRPRRRDLLLLLLQVRRWRASLRTPLPFQRPEHEAILEPHKDAHDLLTPVPLMYWAEGQEGGGAVLAVRVADIQI